MANGRRRTTFESARAIGLRCLVLLLFATGVSGCGDLDGDGYTIRQGDCDDSDPFVNPFAQEVCDGIDQDCDGKVDEGLTIQVFPDADGDGFGVEQGAIEACGGSAGYVTNDNDCDDANANVYPGATEQCNGVDDNCDGTVDEGATTRYYQDADGDGYGASDVFQDVCVAPEGFIDDGGDCDDTDPDVHPWAVDDPNGVDDDCNGTVDDLFLGVAAGRAHSLALRSDGTVWAWGSNSSGQLGDGTMVDSVQPVEVVGVERATAIAAGYDHALALVVSGGTTKLMAWGSNEYGQLGDDTTVDAAEPIEVPLSGVVSVAAGAYFSLAIVSETGEVPGDVWSWGDNVDGQLGDGSLDSSLVPVKVKTVRDVVALGAGDYHAFAIEEGGDVYAWGRNDEGQLGDGSVERQVSPVKIYTTVDLEAIAAGFSHSVGIGEEGGLYAWGVYDEDLDAGTADVAMRPTAMEGPGNLSAIVAGSYHTVALDADAVLWSWGENDSGQLGDGTTTPDWTPEKRPELDQVIGLAAGAYHTLALTSQGEIWAWGSNAAGQLGDWTFEDRATPVLVKWSL